MKKEVLRIENVTRSINGVVVLNNVNLHIFKGEIMGLIFLTSHGKKELIEIICRNIPIDYGRLYYKNEMVNYYKYSNMSTNPIYIIGQDNRLISSMTVSDNIFVMRQGLKKRIINRKELRNQFNYLFRDVPNSLEPDKLISELTRLERCLVELFRAIVADCKLIIIQDISNYLNTADLVKFFEYIQIYSSKGIAFLNIANNHDELFKICNRVALMENSRIVKVLDQHELAFRNIKPYSNSYEVPEPYVKDFIQSGLLTFQEVCSQTLKNISFSIQQGECAIICDKSNDIYDDLLKLILGEKEADSGKIYYNNKLHTMKTALKAIDNKILVIDKDPLKNMIFWHMSYLDNLMFLVDKKINHSYIRQSIRKSIIDEYVKYIGNDIYETDIQKLDCRSHYNLVYFRAHLFSPRILICIQPFSNADMCLKKHIVELLLKLKKKGITIIIFSMSFDDSLAVADRLMLFEEGIIIKSYEKNEFSHFIDSVR